MAEEQPTTNNQKKMKAFLVVGIIVSLGLLFGYFYTSYRKTHIATDDAFVEGNIHTIAPRVSGMVKAIAATDNQRVKKGDLLVELDPADYRSRRDAAKANLDLQRANLKLAELEKARTDSLYKKEVASRDRYDKAVSALEVASAQVKLAAEQLRQADLNLGYTAITAPADGYITRKSVQIGNQVQTGQPLMALVSLEDIWVIANYKETEMANIKPGQDVEIKVDSYPGKVFKGKVDSIMAGTGVSFSLFPAENATGNYVKVVQRIPVKIRLQEGADTGHVLRVGMSVEPTVIAK